ncbi:hypothetical protein IFM89_017392, partial [Coptis chinensis]
CHKDQLQRPNAISVEALKKYILVSLIQNGQAPIVSGREPTTSKDERKLGVERSGELSEKFNRVSF